MPVADMDPSDAKLVSQARAAAAARAAATSSTKTPFGQASSAADQAVIKKTEELKAKLETRLADALKQQVTVAAAQGATGDYSNMSSIMKNPEAYQAFKDARLERVKETRIANTPIKQSTIPQVIPSSTGSVSYGGSITTTTTTNTPTPTPATPSNTATAPSRTFKERSTSIVKSTCPGVSMMLIACPFQGQEVAAAVIVIPLSRSCFIQSITVSPS